MLGYTRPERSLPGPVPHRQLRVVSNRVVDLETRQIHDALWLAVALVSDPLPTGPHLASPIELVESGTTEQEAVSNLEQRIASI
jgi:hypothetical protein